MAAETTLESHTILRRLGTSSEIRIIAACGMGTALEWFDFVAYAMFAPIIAQTFFPTGNELTSLLTTFGEFGECFELRRLVFFFQAEDGIRDWSVTGVQTCALPI